MSSARQMRNRAERAAEQLLVTLEDQRCGMRELSGTSVPELAAKLDPDWAIPILMTTWNRLTEDEEDPNHPIRGHVKRALEEVLRLGGGYSRSNADLANLISLGWIRLEEDANDWFSDRRAEVWFTVQGRALPTARDARALLRAIGPPHYSIHRVAEIITGNADPADIFSHHIPAPHLARLPGAGTAPTRIWRGILARLQLFESLVQHYGHDRGLVAVPERVFFQLFSNDDAVIFTPDDIRDLIETPRGQTDVDVTSNPVIKANGIWWTSSYLVTDSIAPWLLRQLETSELRQSVISAVFEDEVVGLLREHGYQAGSVSKAGCWSTQMGKVQLGSGPGEAGEIDVLATRGNLTLVLECKSPFPMSNPRNLVERLASENAAYRSQARAKGEWVRSHMGNDPDLVAVVFEAAEYLSADETQRDVPSMPLSILKEILEAWDEP